MDKDKREREKNIQQNGMGPKIRTTKLKMDFRIYAL